MKLELKHLAPYLPYGLKYYPSEKSDLFSDLYADNALHSSWNYDLALESKDEFALKISNSFLTQKEPFFSYEDGEIFLGQFNSSLGFDVDDVYLSEVKPVLFPLSSLTKEMYYKLSGKNENDDFGFFYGKNNGDFDKRDYIYRQGYSGRTYMLEDGYYQFPYEMMDFFFKNKFDVFGLIDAGLAEPVTEDFNPYK